jgi:hypothetical protein
MVIDLEESLRIFVFVEGYIRHYFIPSVLLKLDIYVYIYNIKLILPVVISHKVLNMSKDMFKKKILKPVDGFLENEPVFGRVKFTLDGF